MKRLLIRVFLALSTGLVALSGAAAQAWMGAGRTAPDFDQQIAPLLARHCLECHSPGSRQGGLDLTQLSAAQTGGARGPALVPGKPEASLLWKRVAAGEMPPRHPLPAAERAQLKAWIAAGAPWPRPVDPLRYSSSRRAGYDWWSLQPLAQPRVPQPRQKSWVVQPIDSFVLARLEAAGLKPSPAADRVTLIRRVTFDLTGLPPTPEEVDAFQNDRAPGAYERVVDRLLASPHYGERWARHWLDVVRFGESQGFERNHLRPNAWKYRDWVVDALNSDLPYTEFIRLQLAGDVLRPDDPLAVIASGFLVIGPYDLTAYTAASAMMRADAREEELEGLIGTVGQTFLGLTTNCARCHDHKFDPISQREYYRLAAALVGTYHGSERQVKAAPIPAGTGELRARLLGGGPVHTTAPQNPGPVAILARGDWRRRGEVVAPGGLAALRGVSAEWPLPAEASEGERRKALAGWIADPANPLTARVMVNRLWGWHFGAGLVRTPSDFGFNGGKPSHPELLDWLAREFAARGFSLKAMHRLMVLSATYRQGSRPVAAARKRDAENRLLWRFTPRRLEAEAFRDAALRVSGDLDLRVGGPGFRDWTSTGGEGNNNQNYTVFEAVGPEYNRRTLYRTVIRAASSPLLDVLDCPDPSVAAPRRTETTTPLQALSLLNNKFMEHTAAQWARRLERECPGDVGRQIQRAYRLALGREPRDEEAALGREFVARHGAAQYCLVLLNTNEFAYLD